MAEEIKFSKEEIKEINNVQKVYADIEVNLGQIAIRKLKMEQQLNQLIEVESNYRKEFLETQNLEKNILEKINKKYGDGVLNPESGVFTPQKK